MIGQGLGGVSYMEKAGIKKSVIEEICGLAKKHGLEKVILFGSRARGDYGRASDNRNDMSHIYDGNAAKNLVKRILEKYIPQFLELERELKRVYGDIL